VAVYRRTSRRRSVLILLVLTSITLITLDARGNGSGVTRTIRDAARDSMAPVQSAVDDVLSPVDDWVDGVTRSADLKQENRVLRRQLAQARGEAAASRGALRENKELRSLAHLPYAQGLPGVTAQVVLGSPGNFESTIALDKGTNDGVRNGMPVVTGDGLVGRVVQASRRRATVLLLTDPESGVSVRLERTGDLGIVNGRSGSSTLRLDSVQTTGGAQSKVDVKKGELVFTSGLNDSVYPANIPVGRVESIRQGGGGVEQVITVRPLADVGRDTFVRALKYSPREPGG
jgi:rod shape-determining protein MreC